MSRTVLVEGVQGCDCGAAQAQVVHLEGVAQKGAWRMRVNCWWAAMIVAVVVQA